MPDPAHPLARLAEPGRARLVVGQAGVVLAERRVGGICEIVLWPSAGDGTISRLSAAIGLGALPSPGNTVVAGGENIVFAVAPRRFEAISPEPGLAELLEPALPPEEGALVDLSHGRGCVRLVGPAAQDVLQKGLDLDLDLTAFPAISAARSAIHHMPATVLRLEAETFDVFTFRGFAVSLWEWLTDAAIEYGWRAAPPLD